MKATDKKPTYGRAILWIAMNDNDGANEATDSSGLTEERVAELQEMLRKDANGDPA